MTPVTTETLMSHITFTFSYSVRQELPVDISLRGFKTTRMISVAVYGFKIKPIRRNQTKKFIS
jgi:hypothetical protein